MEQNSMKYDEISCCISNYEIQFLDKIKGEGMDCLIFDYQRKSFVI